MTDPNTPFGSPTPVGNHGQALSIPFSPDIVPMDASAASVPSAAPSSPESIVFALPDLLAFDRIKSVSNHAFDALPVCRIKLAGFESYLVEQWVARRSIASQIVTYTGNPQDTVVAYRLEIVRDSTKWPAAFRSYMHKLNDSRYTFPTHSDYGVVFVTNVAHLDASLSLVSVPGGDLRAVYSSYVVNHNLKKLGCGSRTATAIAVPSKPVEDKFRTTSRVPHQVPLNFAVRELVCIVQTMLFYYGLLEPQYCDGMFCDGTELAIKKWWKMIAAIKGCDTLLPQRPPNCSMVQSMWSVIGLTVVVRSLFDLGAGSSSISVPKDVLDVKRMRAVVTQFQRIEHIDRPLDHEGYLDRETLELVLQWTQTTISAKDNQNLVKDFAKVKNLVKNTVMDLSSIKALQSFAGISSSSKEVLKRCMNCQDLDRVLLLPLGKRLTYLTYGKGHPIDLDEESLASKYRRAVQAMNESTAATAAAGTGPTGATPTPPPQQLPSASSSALGLGLGLVASHRPPSSMAGSSSLFRDHPSGSLLHSPFSRSGGGGLFDSKPSSAVGVCVGPGTPCPVGCGPDPCDPCDPCTASPCGQTGDTRCYQRDEDDIAFDRRLKRRHSIAIVGKEASMLSTDIELVHPSDEIDPTIIYSPRREVPCSLRRSASFSAVEESLETGGSDIYDYSQDYSLITIEWLAVQYIKLQREYKLGVLKRSDELKRHAAASRMQLLNQMHIDRIEAKFQNVQGVNARVISKDHELVKKLKTGYKMNARLKYELRLLLQKTKEVESSLKSLKEFKIQALQDKIKEAADDFHVDTTVSQCVACTTTSPDQPLDWKALLLHPWLIFYMLYCYIRGLWTVYFETPDGSESKSCLLQGELAKLIDTPRLKND